jgi:hypothetical protein
MLLSLGGHSYEIVKTHLQHVLTAVAINLVRLDAFLRGTPRGKTPLSHLARLHQRAPALKPTG